MRNKEMSIWRRIALLICILLSFGMMFAGITTILPKEQMNAVGEFTIPDLPSGTRYNSVSATFDSNYHIYTNTTIETLKNKLRVRGTYYDEGAQANVSETIASPYYAVKVYKKGDGSVMEEVTENEVLFEMDGTYIFEVHVKDVAPYVVPGEYKPSEAKDYNSISFSFAAHRSIFVDITLEEFKTYLVVMGFPADGGPEERIYDTELFTVTVNGVEEGKGDMSLTVGGSNSAQVHYNNTDIDDVSTAAQGFTVVSSALTSLKVEVDPQKAKRDGGYYKRTGDYLTKLYPDHYSLSGNYNVQRYYAFTTVMDQIDFLKTLKITGIYNRTEKVLDFEKQESGDIKTGDNEIVRIVNWNEDDETYDPGLLFTLPAKTTQNMTYAVVVTGVNGETVFAPIVVDVVLNAIGSYSTVYTRHENNYYFSPYTENLRNDIMANGDLTITPVRNDAAWLSPISNEGINGFDTPGNVIYPYSLRTSSSAADEDITNFVKLLDTDSSKVLNVAEPVTKDKVSQFFYIPVSIRFYYDNNNQTSTINIPVKHELPDHLYASNGGWSSRNLRGTQVLGEDFDPTGLELRYIWKDAEDYEYEYNFNLLSKKLLTRKLNVREQDISPDLDIDNDGVNDWVNPDDEKVVDKIPLDKRESLIKYAFEDYFEVKYYSCGTKEQESQFLLGEYPKYKLTPEVQSVEFSFTYPGTALKATIKLDLSKTVFTKQSIALPQMDTSNESLIIYDVESGEGGVVREMKGVDLSKMYIEINDGGDVLRFPDKSWNWDAPNPGTDSVAEMQTAYDKLKGKMVGDPTKNNVLIKYGEFDSSMGTCSVIITFIHGVNNLSIEVHLTEEAAKSYIFKSPGSADTGVSRPSDSQINFTISISSALVTAEIYFLTEDGREVKEAIWGYGDEPWEIVAYATVGDSRRRLGDGDNYTIGYYGASLNGETWGGYGSPQEIMPTNAGTYSLKLTIAASSDFIEASTDAINATKFTIKPQLFEVSVGPSPTYDGTTYYKAEDQLIFTPIKSGDDWGFTVPEDVAANNLQILKGGSGYTITHADTAQDGGPGYDDANDGYLHAGTYSITVNLQGDWRYNFQIKSASILGAQGAGESTSIEFSVLKYLDNTLEIEVEGWSYKQFEKLASNHDTYEPVETDVTTTTKSSTFYGKVNQINYYAARDWDTDQNKPLDGHERTACYFGMMNEFQSFNNLPAGTYYAYVTTSYEHDDDEGDYDLLTAWTSFTIEKSVVDLVTAPEGIIYDFYRDSQFDLENWNKVNGVTYGVLNEAHKNTETLMTITTFKGVNTKGEDISQLKYVENSSAFSAKEAGTYTFVVYLKDTANYKWAEGANFDQDNAHITFTFTIGKATIKPLSPGDDATYNEELIPYVIKGLDSVITSGDDTLASRGNSLVDVAMTGLRHDKSTAITNNESTNFTFNNNGEIKAKEAGVYTIVFSLRENAALNYQWASEGWGRNSDGSDIYNKDNGTITFIFTINKAKIQPLTKGADVTYNGSLQALVINGLDTQIANKDDNISSHNGLVDFTMTGLRHDGHTVIADSADNFTHATLASISAKEAGVYTLKLNISQKEDVNYQWAEQGEWMSDGVVYSTDASGKVTITITFTVGKASIQPLTKGEDVTYNGSLQTYTIGNLGQTMANPRDTVEGLVDFTMTGLRHDGDTEIDTLGGNNFSFDSLDSIKAREAGVYTIKLNIKAENKVNYQWATAGWDTNNNGSQIYNADDDSVTFIFTVNKAQKTLPVSSLAAKNWKDIVEGERFEIDNFDNVIVKFKDLKGTTFTTKGNKGETEITYNEKGTDSTYIVTSTDDGKLYITPNVAANYQITLYLTDTLNYEWTDTSTEDKTITFVLNREVLTFSWEPEGMSYTFDGSEHQPQPTATNASIATKGARLTLSALSYNEEDAEGDPVSAINEGTYYVKIYAYSSITPIGTLTYADNYMLPEQVVFEFTITSSELEKPIVDRRKPTETSVSTIYDGSDKYFSNYIIDYSVKYLIDNDHEKNKIVIKVDELEGHDPEIRRVKREGPGFYYTSKVLSYKVSITPNDNYTWKGGGKEAVEFTFTIEPLEVELWWNELDWIYGDMPKNPTAEILNKAPSDDVYTYVTYLEPFPSGYPIEAGRYQVEINDLRGQDAGNYTISNSNKFNYVTISQQGVNKPTIDYMGSPLVYNSYEQNVTIDMWQTGIMSAEVTGVNPWIESRPPVYDAYVDEYGKFYAKYAGEYTITVKLTDGMNYYWIYGDDSNVILKITIERATIYAPVLGEARAHDYDENVYSPASAIKEFSPALIGKNYEVTYGSYKDGAYIDENAVASSKEIGEYFMRLKITAEDMLNYVWALNMDDQDSAGYVSLIGNTVYDEDNVSVYLHYAITKTRITIKYAITGYTYGDNGILNKITDDNKPHIIDDVDGNLAKIVGSAEKVTISYYRVSSKDDPSVGTLVGADELEKELPWEAGFYKVHIDIVFGEGAGYEDIKVRLETADTMLIVSPRVIELSWSGDSEATYDGTEYGDSTNEPSVVVTNAVTRTAVQDSISLLITIQGQDGRPINVNRSSDRSVIAWTLQASSIEGDAASNYTLDGTTGNEYTFTIKPATIKVKAKGGSLTYGDEFDTARGFVDGSTAYDLVEGFVNSENFETAKIKVENTKYILDKLIDGEYKPYAVGAAYGSVGEYRIHLALSEGQVLGFTAQNYNFVEVDEGEYNHVTVSHRKIDVFVNANKTSSDYGDPLHTLSGEFLNELLSIYGGSATSLVAGDTFDSVFSGQLKTTAKASYNKDDNDESTTNGFSHAGNYAICLLNGTGNGTVGNYNVTLYNYEQAYVVNLKMIEIVWNTERQFVYDGTDFTQSANTDDNPIAYFIDPSKDGADENQKVALSVFAVENKGSIRPVDFKYYKSTNYILYINGFVESGLMAGKYGLPEDPDIRYYEGFKIEKRKVEIKGIDVNGHIFGEDVKETEKKWDYSGESKTNASNQFHKDDLYYINSHITVYAYTTAEGPDLITRETPVGNYYVVISLDGGNEDSGEIDRLSNYDITRSTGNFEIVQRKIVITVNEEYAKSAYGENIKSFAAGSGLYTVQLAGDSGATGNAIANGVADDTVFTLFANNLGKSIDSTTPVGQYTIELSQVNDNYEITFTLYHYTITPATITDVSIEGYNDTYDAQPHNVFEEYFSASTKNEQELKWYYVKVENDNGLDADGIKTAGWQLFTAVNMPKQTNVGNYYYAIKVSADNHYDYYLGFTGSGSANTSADETYSKNREKPYVVTATISKAIVEVTLNLEIFYGEENPANYNGIGGQWKGTLEDLISAGGKYSISGIKAEDMDAFRSGTLAGWDDGDNFTYSINYTKGDDVGEDYKITLDLSGIETDNYTFVDSGSGKLKVKKLQITVTLNNLSSPYNFNAKDEDKHDLQSSAAFSLVVTSTGTYNGSQIEVYDREGVDAYTYTKIFTIASLAQQLDKDVKTAVVGAYAIYATAGEKYNNYDITWAGNWGKTDQTTGQEIKTKDGDTNITGTVAGIYTITNATITLNSTISAYGSAYEEGILYDEAEHYALQLGTDENKSGSTDNFATTVDNCATTWKYLVFNANQTEDAINEGAWSSALTSMPKFIDVGSYYVYYRVEAANHSPVSGLRYHVVVKIAKTDNAWATDFSMAGAEKFKDASEGVERFPSVAAWTYGLYNSANNAKGFDANDKNRATIAVGKFDRIPAGNDGENQLSVTLYYYRNGIGDGSQVASTTFKNGSGVLTEVLKASLNAGYYRIVFSIAGNANYNELSAEFGFKIDKKDLKVKANDFTITYGDNVPSYTYTATGFVSNGSEMENTSIFVTIPTFNCAYLPGAENGSVGEYEISISNQEELKAQETALNYEITFENGTVTVGRRALTLRIDDKQDAFNMNGMNRAQIPLTATVVGGTSIYTGDYDEGSQQIVYTLKTTAYDANGEFKTQNVGDYPIYVVFNNVAGKGFTYEKNYILTVQSGSYSGDLPDEAVESAVGNSAATFKIIPATLEILVEGPYYHDQSSDADVKYGDETAGLIYDGKAKIYKAVMEGHEFTAEYKLQSQAGDIWTQTPFKDAGTYIVRFISSNENYSTEITKIFTITRRVLTVTTSVTNEGGGDELDKQSGYVFSYNGAKFELVPAFGNDVEGEEVSYKVEYTGDSFPKKGESAPTFAGIYTGTITLTSKDGFDCNNYTFVSGEAKIDVSRKITINKSTIAVPTTSQQSLSYTGEDLTFYINNYNDKSDYQGTKILSHTVSVAELDGDDGGTTRLTYKVEKDSSKDDSYKLTARNAGKYTIQISLTDSENYVFAAGQTSITFTISKADIYVRAEDVNIEYGTPLNESSSRFGGFNVTYRTFKDGDQADDEHYFFTSGLAFDTNKTEGSGAYDASTAQSGDRFTITPKGLKAYNYNISYVPGTLTVVPRKITVNVKGFNDDNTYAQSPYSGLNQQGNLDSLLSGNLNSFLEPEAGWNGETADTLDDLKVSLSIANAIHYKEDNYAMTPSEASDNYDITFDGGNHTFAITKVDLHIKIGLFDDDATFETLNTSPTVTYGDTVGDGESSGTRLTIRYSGWQEDDGNEKQIRSAQRVGTAFDYSTSKKTEGTEYRPGESHAGEVYTISVTGITFNDYNIILDENSLTVVSRIITVSTTDREYTEEIEEGAKKYNNGVSGAKHDATITFANTVVGHDADYDLKYSGRANDESTLESSSTAPVKAGQYTILITLKQNGVPGGPYYDYIFDQSSAPENMTETTNQTTTLAFNVNKRKLSASWDHSATTFTEGVELETNSIRDYIKEIMGVQSFTRTYSEMVDGEASSKSDIIGPGTEDNQYSIGTDGLTVKAYGNGTYTIIIYLTTQATKNYEWLGNEESDSITLTFRVTATLTNLTVEILGWTYGQYDDVANAPKTYLAIEGIVTFEYFTLDVTKKTLPEDLHVAMALTGKQWTTLLRSHLTGTSTNAPINAGIYVIHAKYAGDSANAPADAYYLFEVKKATIDKPTIDPDYQKDYFYTGAEQIIKGTGYDASTMRIYSVHNFTIDEDDVISSRETNAGTYTVTITLIDKANYIWTDEVENDEASDVVLTWVISPATDNTVTMGEESYTTTYGTPVTPTASSKYNGEIKFYYLAAESLPDAGAEGWDEIQPTQVAKDGTHYYIKAVSESTDNYNEATKIVELVINRAQLHVTPVGTNLTYGDTFDGSACSYTVDLADLKYSDLQTVVSGKGEYLLKKGDIAYSVGRANGSVGTYTLSFDVNEDGSVKGLTADNYMIVGYTSTIEVVAKQISVKLPNRSSTYSQPLNLDNIDDDIIILNEEPLVAGDTKKGLGIKVCVYAGDKSKIEDGTIADAGSYPLVAEPEWADKNYSITFYDGVYTIDRKTITIESIIVGNNVYGNVTEAKFKVEGDGNEYTSGSDVDIDGRRKAVINIIYTGTANDLSTHNDQTLPQKAGVYTLSLVLSEDSAKNYVLAGTTIESFNVDRKELSYSEITAGTLKYTGNEKSLSADDVADKIVITIADDNEAKDKFTASANSDWVNAGTYYISLTLKDEYYNNYRWAGQEKVAGIPFVIEKADNNTVTIEDITGWVYDGTYHEEAISASATFGSVTYLFSQSTGDDASWTPDRPVNAGTWYVKAQVEDNTNFNGAEMISSAFTISARKVKVEINSPSGNVYGFSIAPATGVLKDNESVKLEDGQFSALVAGVVITFKYNGVANDGTSYSDSKEAPTHAGTFTVTASIKDGNFELTEDATEDFVVERATVYGYDITTTLVYNGKSRSADEAISSATGYRSLYQLDIDADVYNSDTHSSNSDQITVRTVGKYKFSLKLIDKNNYAWAEALTSWGENNESAEFELSITPALEDVEVEIALAEGDNWGWNYGDEVSTERYKVTVKVGGNEIPTEDYSYTIEFLSDGTWSATIPTNGGNYQVRASITSDDVKANQSSGQIFEIGKLKLKVEVTSPSNNVYLENPQPAEVKFYKDRVEEEYSLDRSAYSLNYYGTSNDSTFDHDSKNSTVEMPTVAGNYKVWVSITDLFKSNFELIESDAITAESAKDFVIAKKTLHSGDYNAQSDTVYYNATNLIGKVDLSALNLSANGLFTAKLGVETMIDAGIYPIKLTLTDANNYCWSSPDEGNEAEATINFTVSMAIIKLNAPSITGWRYGSYSAGTNAPSATGYYNFGIDGYQAEVSTDLFQYQYCSQSGEAPDGIWVTGIPERAGKYYVRVLLSGTQNYAETTSAETLFEILKEQIEKPVFKNERTDYSTKYTGNNQEIEIKNFVGSAMSFATSTSVRFDAEISKLVASTVGSHTITFTLLDTHNYEWKNGTNEEVTLTWNLEIADENTVTLTLTQTTWTYGTDASSLVSASSQFGEVKFHFKAAEAQGWTDGLPTDAGTYTVEAYVEADASGNYPTGSDSKQVTIERAVLTVTPNSGSIVYGEALPTTGFVVGDKAYTFTGFVNGDQEEVVEVREFTFDSSYHIGAPVNTYDLKLKEASGEVVGFTAKNYKIVSGSGELTVTAKKISIQIGNAESSYHIEDVSLENVEFTLADETQLVENDSIEGLGITIKSEATNDHIDTGTYPIVAADYSNKNYEITFYDGIYTIKALRIRVEISAGGGVYGEEIADPTITKVLLEQADGEYQDFDASHLGHIPLVFYYSGTSNDGTWSYEDTNHTTTKPTLAGNYTVSAQSSDSKNYILVSASNSQPFIIERATIDSSKITAASQTYTGSPLQPVLHDANNYKGLNAENVYHVSYDNNMINVGKYTINLTLLDNIAYNHKWNGLDDATATVEFEITKAENSLTSSISIVGWTYGKYDEHINAPSATVQFGTPIFMYSTSRDEGWENAVPINGNAGVYYVRVTVLEGDNWTRFDSQPVSFTISKAGVNVPTIEIITEGANKNDTYTGEELSAVVSGIDSAIMTITYEQNINTSGGVVRLLAKNAGSYVARVKLTDTTNYYWIESAKLDSEDDSIALVVWNIARKKVEKPSAVSTKFVANGQGLEYIPEGFDADIMDIENNTTSSPGQYTVTVSLKDVENYEWADGTDSVIEIEWVVEGGNLGFYIICGIMAFIALILLAFLIRYCVKIKKRKREQRLW